MALVLPALAAADAAGPQLVGYVNAKRAAHGFPAGITENPVQSLGCQAHNRYGALNDVLTHFEDATAPGSTDAGAAAGPLAVLYRGAAWTAANDPFEHAPIHLHKLLAPRIDSMGAWESEGFGCATVASRGRNAPSRNVTYTYPADGTTGWRESEVAEELPFTPGELLGIPPETTTGPYLYVLFDGPGVTPADEARVTRASLKGPAGRVAIAIADNTTPRGLHGYLPIGAEIIPRAPLAPGTTYTAAISAIVGTTRFRHRWSFTTAGVPPAIARSVSNATAARSAHSSSGPAVQAVRRARALQLRLRCPRACLVRGVGLLRSGEDSLHLPDARGGRLTGGTVKLRFRLSPGARRWLAAHPFRRLKVAVSGLFVAPMTATLRYARTSGSSSADLPLAPSVRSRSQHTDDTPQSRGVSGHRRAR